MYINQSYQAVIISVVMLGKIKTRDSWIQNTALFALPPFGIRMLSELTPPPPPAPFLAPG